mmetsp:Transcript_19203/g.51720  ORF Transcript_19203/g.51720 Transcript_19203/m.51720 type:complete len:230 (-) Transcript_19203:1244-1933(-)
MHAVRHRSLRDSGVVSARFQGHGVALVAHNQCCLLGVEHVLLAPILPVDDGRFESEGAHRALARARVQLDGLRFAPEIVEHGGELEASGTRVRVLLAQDRLAASEGAPEVHLSLRKVTLALEHGAVPMGRGEGARVVRTVGSKAHARVGEEGFRFAEAPAHGGHLGGAEHDVERVRVVPPLPLLEHVERAAVHVRGCLELALLHEQVGELAHEAHGVRVLATLLLLGDA